ncbi:hypothetical protein NQT62_09850 [Limnobacter humi]|uniref:Uncharacterized protein n=1 Tax=Limnobacter humi TaxID=1778671 RepID=A0ABT1WGU4_9BURK|nr:hypothetical protein [Limnobacter humi]MCQ8896734.1 hypothetical protein [Limnobacter humi]
MKKLKAEEAILEFHFRQNEKQGLTPNTGRIDLDEKTLSAFNLEMNLKLSIDEFNAAGSVCIANQWLKHTVLGGGSGRYIRLCLTTQGVGVVRSNRASLEQEASRGWLERSLLFFNKYQGATAIFAAVLGLIGLAVFGG